MNCTTFPLNQHLSKSPGLPPPLMVDPISMINTLGSKQWVVTLKKNTPCFFMVGWNPNKKNITSNLQAEKGPPCALQMLCNLRWIEEPMLPTHDVGLTAGGCGRLLTLMCVPKVARHGLNFLWNTMKTSGLPPGLLSCLKRTSRLGLCIQFSRISI